MQRAQPPTEITPEDFFTRWVPVQVASDEQRRRQRNRNIALMVVLLALVALFYVITIVRIGGGA